MTQLIEGMPESASLEGAGASADVLLRVREARVAFGDFVAVKDVSFSLHGGNLLGLIGPNGAGKTTLLRAIAGIQELVRGGVYVMGRMVEPGATDALRHIGFTPDTPWLYDELTVRQFLRFIAKAYHLSGTETDERIDFWLEKVWLAEKADQRIKALSRGMRQRLGIARTLLSNPNVILLDEPAAGLDPAGRVQFRQLLAALRNQGKVLIVSSHILADMNEYCTHIGIISGGALVQFGTVSEVAGSASTGRCRYTIQLARPVAGAVQRVAEIQGISHLQGDGQRLLAEYDSEPQRAAELLSKLVRMDLPVCSFSANAPGLEEAYLRTGIRQVD